MVLGKRWVGHFQRSLNLCCRSGGDSTAVREAVKQNDALLNQTLDTLEMSKILETTNIIVVGDHGMMDHQTNYVIYLSDYGVQLADLLWVTGSFFTTGMLFPREDKLNSVSFTSTILYHYITTQQYIKL